MKIAKILDNKKQNQKDEREVSLLCSDCGNYFNISVGELCWHYEIGNKIPQRCLSCKEKKKESFKNSTKKEVKK